MVTWSICRKVNVAIGELLIDIKLCAAIVNYARSFTPAHIELIDRIDLSLRTFTTVTVPCCYDSPSLDQF